MGLADSLDKFVDAMMNIQLVQMISQSLGSVLHGPSPTDAFSNLFSGFFQMLMPVMFLGIFMRFFEKLA